MRHTVLVIMALLACLVCLLPAQAAGPAFQTFGHAVNLSGSAINCLNAQSDCTFPIGGQVNGSIKGSFSSTITVFGRSARSPNGLGSFCERFRGFATMSINGVAGQSLSLFEQGTVCTDGAPSPSAPHSFDATYTVTGGTGIFEGSSGVGALSMHENGANTFEFNYEGSLLPGPQSGN